MPAGCCTSGLFLGALKTRRRGHEEEDYYSATIVAYNSRCAPRKGRFLLHFDCGLRKRVQLPDETVRIMTRRVSSCSCQKSPGGVAGCCEGTDGCEELPRPWEAEPK